MALTKATNSMIAGAPLNVVDYGASTSNTNAENKTALQAAIVAASDAGGGTVVVPAEINYGYVINNPSTYPDFSVLTIGDVVVEDRSAQSNETPSPSKTGAQVRYFFGTVQTSPTGQHNGNGQVITSDWSPYYAIRSANPPDQPPGSNTDPYRASLFFEAVDASGNTADWRLGQRDASVGYTGTTLEQWTGFGLSTSGKFIYDTGASSWRFTSGTSVLSLSRYTGCWGFNTVSDPGYAYKFYIPTGMPSNEAIVLGQTDAPNFSLANLADSRDFKIRAMTGSYSYRVVAHGITRFLFDTNGWTHITNSTTASSVTEHTIEKTGLSQGDAVLGILATGLNSTAEFFATTNAGANVSATGVRFGTNSSTGRSINAGGTINASGADYAEYEQNNGLTIAKGAVVGFKADGTLTLTFAEAVRFGVKSTDPSFIGGDSWGADLGGAALEAARVNVDRVAYAGKVPVNVTGATAGGYIIAAAAQDGSITGEFVADPDFSQYKKAVGRVNKILADGRAEVAVIVH